MILSKFAIRDAMEEGKIGISGFKPENLQPNSYDVSLGEWFYLVAVVEGERTYFGPKKFLAGEKVPLIHGYGLLGMTAEYIVTSAPFFGQLRAKSTSGREFFNVAGDSGYGDIDYANYWTAEFVSHLFGVTYLTVGQLFGQMVFHRADPGKRHPHDLEGYGGQYAAIEFPFCMVPKKYRDKTQPWENFFQLEQTRGVKLVGFGGSRGIPMQETA